MTSPPAFRAERSAWRHSAGGYTGRGASSGYRGTVPRNLANLFTPKRDKGASPRPAPASSARLKPRAPHALPRVALRRSVD